MKTNKTLEKGSSIIIALIVIVLVVFALNHYGITFSAVVSAVKHFFNIN